MKRLTTFLMLAAALPVMAQSPPAPVAPVAPAAPVAPSVNAAEVQQLNHQVEALRQQLHAAQKQIEELRGSGGSAPEAAVSPAPVVHTGSMELRGQDYTVQPYEIVDGNVRLMGGNLDVEGRVNGDASTSGGNLAVVGHVTGNVATVGGNVHLYSNSVVDGDVQVMGGTLRREPGSQVHGSVRITGGGTPAAALSRAPHFASALIATPMNLPMAFALFFVGTILLVASPRRMDTVGQAFVNRPVHSFLVGLTSVPVFLLICATIIGLFFAPVVWMSAFVMGVCAMALMLGRRLAIHRRYRSRIFPLVVGLGAWFLAMVFSRMIGPLYPVMVVATVLAYVTALGATFSTGFGKSPLWLRDRLQGRGHRDPFSLDASETYAGR